MKEELIKRPKTALRVSLTALFAALIAAGAFISVPIPISPVPVALQNLFVVLAGIILGPGLASTSIITYLVIGALGAPVFAGAKGGLAHFFGPTGGYLFGYLLAAPLAAWIAGKKPIKTPLSPRLIIAVLSAFLIIYLPGLARLKALLNTDWPKTLAAGFLPFIIGDVFKALAVIALAPRLRRLYIDLLNA